MTSYKMEACRVEDAPLIARNNVMAFSEDTTWMLMWAIPIEEIIETATRRSPWNLLRDRDCERHIKAVDPTTGELLGYIRWELPKSKAGAWPEAQAAGVSEEDATRYREMQDAAQWVTREETNGIDDAVGVIKERLLAEKEYMSKYTNMSDKALFSAAASPWDLGRQQQAFSAFL
jgi:hypothetical protein